MWAGYIWWRHMNIFISTPSGKPLQYRQLGWPRQSIFHVPLLPSIGAQRRILITCTAYYATGSSLDEEHTLPDSLRRYIGEE